MNYAVRITREYEAFNTMSAVKLVNACDKLVIVEHPADEQVKRTHCHLLLVGCKVSTDTLKNWFKKVFGIVEKSDWSFKSADTNAEGLTSYMTYCLKGKYHPKFNNLYEPDVIEELKRRWVDPAQARLKLQDGKLVKEVDEAKSISKRQIVEEIVAEVGDSPSNPRVVLSGIRKVLIRNKCVVGMWKVMDYYDSYLMYAQKDQWLDMIASKIEKRNS